jgi:predicted aconitase
LCASFSTTSTVTIATINGVGPGYAILSQQAQVTQLEQVQESTLAPADYMFQVTDANGCTYQELYTIADVIELQLQQQPHT